MRIHIATHTHTHTHTQTHANIACCVIIFVSESALFGAVHMLQHSFLHTLLFYMQERPKRRPYP